MAWTFSSETETCDFVPPYTVLLLSFRHGFHFRINLYRYQNVLRFIYSFKLWKLTKNNLNTNYGRLLNSTMNVYNLELVRNTMLLINKTYFLFTVYMLFYLTFFHNADLCIFAKTTELFNYIFIQDKYIIFTVSMKFTINRTLRF